MKYIVDSSVAIKWVITEPYSGKADLLRTDFQNAVHELLSPDIFPIEVAHALTRAERQRRVPVGKSTVLLGDVLTTAPQLHPSFPLLYRAVEISSQLRIGMYDCLYVALAEQENCELLTADDKLIQNLQQHFSFRVSLASPP